MDKASVSVVIPSYNSVNTIERAISSISKQTLLPKEVIIVDDCSTDKRTEKILNIIERKYNRYFNLKIIRSDINLGPGASRNIGWKNSNEEYIAFLDADDAWHKYKIEIQYKYMIDNPDVDFSCHNNIILNDEETNYINKSEKVEKEVVTFQQLLFRNKIATRSVMLKRSIKNRFKLGKYHSEDYLLWLEIASSGYKIVRLDSRLAISYSHPFLGDGLSGNLVKMFKGEIDSYNKILYERKINIINYSIIVFFSHARFYRRVSLALLLNFKTSFNNYTKGSE